MKARIKVPLPCPHCGQICNGQLGLHQHLTMSHEAECTPKLDESEEAIRQAMATPVAHRTIEQSRLVMRHGYLKSKEG